MTIVRRSASFLPKSIICLVATGLALGGCTESQRPEATGKGTIRAIHAVPTGADVTFLIEERSLGNLAYKNSTSAQQFDDLTYNFNFDTRKPGTTSLSRIATETVTIAPEMDYVFVLTGTIASPSIVLWETEERQWNGDETTFEVSAGHLSPGSGALDVYFVEKGTAPAAGTERGTLSFGERLAPFEVENGEYQVIVTAAGDPGSVLFSSTSRDYAERTSALFTIQDADPSITTPLSVRRIDQNGNSTELGDPAVPPTRRFFNAAFGSGSMDVYLEEDFAAPIVSNLAYAAASADVPVPTGARTFTFTAAGNPGAILLEDEHTVVINTRGTHFVSGKPDDLDASVLPPDDRRSVTGLGKIRFTQMSAGFAQVDVYFVAPGTDLAGTSPNLSRLATAASSAYIHLDPGNYELTVTKTGEKTVLAGPLAVGLTSGGVREAAIVDTADPNRLDIAVYQ
jgi:hypothetical protein